MAIPQIDIFTGVTLNVLAGLWGKETVHTRRGSAKQKNKCGAYSRGKSHQIHKGLPRKP